MQNLKEKILDFLKIKGPSLPVHISKALNRDTIFTGAVLSELISRKEVKITKAKIGGSPLYYLSGQEEQLNILYNHLPLKEKEAYDFLKEKKSVKDSQTPPSIRVAFTMMKDFAKPHRTEKNELIWKWHIENSEESENSQETFTESPSSKPQIFPQTQPTSIKITSQPQITKEKQQIILQHSNNQTPQPPFQSKNDPATPRQQLSNQISIFQKPSLQIPKKEIQQPRQIIKNPENQHTTTKEKTPHTTQKLLKKTQTFQLEDEFSKKVDEYFTSKNINIIEKKIIRKNSETNYIIKLNTQLGTLSYFVCAKNKKRISDNDLTIAHQKAQEKKMPSIFITSGELTKKAKEHLEKTLKGHIVLRNIK